MKTGVRQRGELSPLLLIIYMDKCLRHIYRETTDAELFVYANDVAVIADMADQLQEEVQRWNT